MIRENSTATRQRSQVLLEVEQVPVAAVRLPRLRLASDRPQRAHRARLTRSTHALRRHSNCVAELQYNEASVSAFEVKPTF